MKIPKPSEADKEYAGIRYPVSGTRTVGTVHGAAGQVWILDTEYRIPASRRRALGSLLDYVGAMPSKKKTKK